MHRNVEFLFKVGPTSKQAFRFKVGPGLACRTPVAWKLPHLHVCCLDNVNNIIYLIIVWELHTGKTGIQRLHSCSFSGKLVMRKKLKKSRKKIKKLNYDYEKKLIKILKKLTDLVWYQFYKFKTEKIKPNKKNWAKSKNRAKLVWTGFFLKKKPKSAGSNQFLFSFGFFLKKIQFNYFFLIKTEPNRSNLLPRKQNCL